MSQQLVFLSTKREHNTLREMRNLKVITQIEKAKAGAHNLLNRQAQRSEINSEKLLRNYLPEINSEKLGTSGSY